MPALPASTEALLRTLDRMSETERFALAGGTALALHIGHRSSQDLDFVSLSPHLPRRQINWLLDKLRTQHTVEPVPNVAAEQDFLNDGLEFADYQQDYAINGVKLSFFVPDSARLANSLRTESGVADLQRIKVLDRDSLFLMKALTLNNRILTRDLYDVFVLLEKHGYKPPEIFKAANEFGYSAESLKQRLIGARKRRDDPGLEALTAETPSFEQLRAYFVAQINKLEQDAAAAAFRKP